MAKRKPRRTGDKAPACEFCGVEVRAGAPGTWRRVTGWVENRSGGGAHAVTKPRGTGEYACSPCMELVKRGIDPANPEPQASLL